MDSFPERMVGVGDAYLDSEDQVDALLPDVAQYIRRTFEACHVLSVGGLFADARDALEDQTGWQEGHEQRE